MPLGLSSTQCTYLQFRISCLHLFARSALHCSVPHQHRRGGKATSCQSLLLLLLLRVVVCYLLILSCSSRPVASKLCASLQRLPTLEAAAAVAATHMLWFPLALPLDPVPLSVRSLVISVVVLIACSAPVWPGLAGAGLGLFWPWGAYHQKMWPTRRLSRARISQSVRQSGSPSVSHPSRRVCLARRAKSLS